jgi:hypothetical protein
MRDAGGLVVELHTIAGINHFTAVLKFEGDGLRGRLQERAGLVGEMWPTARATH